MFITFFGSEGVGVVIFQTTVVSFSDINYDYKKNDHRNQTGLYMYM